MFKTSSKSIYSPVNFIGPDSVTDTDLRLNCRIPVSNCKQNLHYARNSDLKLCAMWHLKINGNAVDIILLYNTSQKIIGFISNILQRYYSGGKKNPDLLLFYQKRTNESETAKQITKNS